MIRGFLDEKHPSASRHFDFGLKFAENTQNRETVRRYCGNGEGLRMDKKTRQLYIEGKYAIEVRAAGKYAHLIPEQKPANLKVATQQE
jgi:hypothetical protein